MTTKGNSNSYYSKIASIVSSSWTPDREDIGKSVKIIITITKHSHLVTIKSFSDRAFGEKVANIVKSLHFPSPPNSTSVDIEFNFVAR
jgi:hypothetical protein